MLLLSRISPVAIYLRLSIIALVGGPLLAIVLTNKDVDILQTLLLGAVPGCTLWLVVASVKLPLVRPQLLTPVPGAQPVAGWMKLLALMVITEPSSILSLTGASIVACHPESGNPVLQEVKPPSLVRLLAEGIILLDILLIWTLLVTWAALTLPAYPFTGLMVAWLGTLTTLVALLQRFAWAAGSSPIDDRSAQVPIRMAPLIPKSGSNRFRGIITPNGHALLRPDVVGAPYESYVIAHEEGHILRKDHWMLWIEPAISLIILLGTGISLGLWGQNGLWGLVLFLPLRSLSARSSYHSELAVDERAATILGRETCLTALLALEAEAQSTPQPWPVGNRYAPTLAERIERLKQRVEV